HATRRAHGDADLDRVTRRRCIGRVRDDRELGDDQERANHQSFPPGGGSTLFDFCFFDCTSRSSRAALPSSCSACCCPSPPCGCGAWACGACWLEPPPPPPPPPPCFFLCKASS